MSNFASRSGAVQTVLAFETSCDDTSVAVVERDGRVRACLSAGQDLHHARFGGIVPEIASRNHTHHLLPLMEETLARAGVSFQDIDALAVTSRPGLVGSLLVGLMTVKGLSLASGKKFLGVNHLEGHLMAPFLYDDQYQPPDGFDFPFVALAVSGGHTTLYHVPSFGHYQVLGRTRDDAAGEAFDKFAKRLGLGFPGGVRVDRLAAVGRADRFNFPRAMLREDHDDMSFSGLKSHAAREVEKLPEAHAAELAQQAKEFLASGSREPRAGLLADFCASFQAAVVDVLAARLERAAERQGVRRIVLTGGVAANSELRLRCEQIAARRGWTLAVPPLRYCTDNAAMIGLAAIIRLGRGEVSPQSLSPQAKAPLDQEDRGVG